jgi:hypothetical protein
VWDYGECKFDVDYDDAEEQYGEGDGGCDGCEYGEGYCEEEEEGYDYCVDWVEECHFPIEDGSGMSIARESE